MKKEQSVRVGIIGEFDESRPSHGATEAAIGHAAARCGIRAEIAWVPTTALGEAAGMAGGMAGGTAGAAGELAAFDGLWCAPGGAFRCMAGALSGIRFARERRRPFMGT